MLVSHNAYSEVASIDIITHIIIIMSLHDNPYTTVISCPINIRDAQETESLYTDLTSLTKQTPQHNVLMIGEDFNAHLGKNDGFE